MHLLSDPHVRSLYNSRTLENLPVPTACSLICSGLNPNEIQIPNDKHHSVLIGKKSPEHTQFCQICSNMRISNNSAKYEDLIKQY